MDGIVTCTEWEPPAGSSVTVTGRDYPTAEGCEQHTMGLKATVYVLHSDERACTCSG